MIIELTDLGVSTETHASDFLALESGLSKSKVKLAMTRGAAWLKTGRRKSRLRRAKAMLRPGDLVSFYYSPEVMEKVPEQPALIDDQNAFSVWEKPPGLMSGGSRFGDHCAINRVVEQQLERPTFLVHRLDRFVWGLMVLAHSKNAAAHLSRQFRARTTQKVYCAIVHGELLHEHSIQTPIDNRDATSHVKPITYCSNKTLVEVSIETGRKHQIRQHLTSIGHPVVGDRLYGSDDTGGIQLASVALGFESPVDGEWKTYSLDEDRRPVMAQDAK